eukprot:3630862-Amphidinium_carterae.1
MGNSAPEYGAALIYGDCNVSLHTSWPSTGQDCSITCDERFQLRVANAVQLFCSAPAQRTTQKKPGPPAGPQTRQSKSKVQRRILDYL